jgi:polyisoprenoid-binding protein YceI
MARQKWVFEPGHTAAEFSVRHMMVSNVRGHFKNVDGSIEIDPDDPTDVVVEATIDAAGIWSGDTYRDEHLRAADFFDVDTHPHILFRGDRAGYVGQNDLRLAGELTIRGVTKDVTLDVVDLGRWDTPFWEDGEDKGPITRAGFSATTRINRHDFGVSWNDALDRGGLVVGDFADVTIDVEALRMPA